jgi:hypothetical protein
MMTIEEQLAAALSRAERAEAALARDNHALADAREEVVALRARLETASCSNAPCPVCGDGPSGEWSEGSEVDCDGCGTALYVTSVAPCKGTSMFALADARCPDCNGHGYVGDADNAPDCLRATLGGAHRRAAGAPRVQDVARAAPSGRWEVSTEHEVRLLLRQALLRLCKSAPGTAFVLIGIGSDRRPQVTHNFESVEDDYNAMRILVDNFDKGDVTKRRTPDPEDAS